MNPLPQALGELAQSATEITRQAVAEYATVVDSIICSQSRDVRHIEHTLDGLLDFCCDPEALVIYKKLCRHYCDINPAATAFYVKAYRELSDSELEVHS